MGDLIQKKTACAGDGTGGFQTVNKVYFFDLCCKSLAEFRRPQTAEEGQIVFSGGVYVGKHTPQAASVRAKASARSGLHPLEKMLAFLRSVSKFFDTLKTACAVTGTGGFFITQRSGAGPGPPAWVGGGTAR